MHACGFTYNKECSIQQRVIFNNWLQYNMRVIEAIKMLKNLFLLILFFTSVMASNKDKLLGMNEANPANSCNEIYQRNPSIRGTIGQYWMKTNEGTFKATCNMKLKCGGVEGGWMQVVDVDMNRDDSCPGSWYSITTPKNLCLGYTNSCNTVTFNVSGIHYENICGQAKAYQKGITGAFYSKSQSIKGTYVDGISIALATPRIHVWTYAVGYSTTVRSDIYNCPCSFYPGTGPPAFVGNDYYCDSGSIGASHKDVYYMSNPLWDGDDCYYSSVGRSGCCAISGLPWFYKRLTLPGAKDFEVSICKGALHDIADIAVEKLEILVI